MRDCPIIIFLKEQREAGNKEYFTTSEILKETKEARRGSTFRKINGYVAKYRILESKIVSNNGHLCRAYRLTERTLKEW